MTLYRILPTREYADDFVNGKIFISTLERCRSIEDKNRQDGGEGSVTYHTGYVSGSNKAASHMVARRAGLHVLDSSPGGVTLSENTFQHAGSNAWVLCLSRTLAQKFGQHVVQIDHPRLLFRALSKALGAFSCEDGTYRGRASGEQGWMKSIQYRDRVYQGFERAPPTSFIKPVSFAEEQEVRMLWPSVDTKQLDHGVVFCPESSRYCRRLLLPVPLQDPPARSAA